jgi:hypothetical protein
MRLSSRPTVRRLIELASIAGVNPYQVACTIRRLPRFVREMRTYERMGSSDFPLVRAALKPILVDYEAPAGVTGHYFHQDLWAARLIAARRPSQHFDIGSRVDGFVGHLLTVMPVTLIDIRALDVNVTGLTFRQGSVVALDDIADNSIESLSTLHAIEHVGLGRYSDPIDPNGWRKAVDELKRVLKPAGRLYFSVPIGRQRLLFNANRIFQPATVVDAFAPLRLVSFSAVDDADRFHAEASVAAFDDATEAHGPS